jgi:hypothetical protein
MQFVSGLLGYDMSTLVYIKVSEKHSDFIYRLDRRSANLLGYTDTGS